VCQIPLLTFVVVGDISYGEPLGIVNFAGTEQSFQRIVARKNEAGEVDQEGATQVEEDQEEVEASQAENHVDFGDAGLPLEIVEDLIFGQLWSKMRQYGGL
jgi:hypothetical protein